MLIDEIARINFMLTIYTVILLLALAVAIYYIYKNERIEKDVKFLLCIGAIFIVFLLYYIPKYCVIINLQKKYLQNVEINNPSSKIMVANMKSFSNLCFCNSNLVYTMHFKNPIKSMVADIFVINPVKSMVLSG